MTSDKTLGIFRSAEERVVWASRAQPSPFARKWNVWNFAVKWRTLERQGLVRGHVWYCHLRLHDKYLEIFGYHMFASRRGAKLQDWLSYGIRIRTVLVEAIRPQTIPKADPLAIYIYIYMFIYIHIYTCTIKITCINRHMQRPPRSGTQKTHISIKKHPTLALRNVIDGVEFRLGIGFSQWDIEAGKSRWSKCAGTEVSTSGVHFLEYLNISDVWRNTKGMVPPRHVSVFITALTKVHGDWYND